MLIFSPSLADIGLAKRSGLGFSMPSYGIELFGQPIFFLSRERMWAPS